MQIISEGKLATHRYGKLMERLNRGEIIFKIIAYVLTTLLAIMALYPLVYAFSASISGRVAYEAGLVTLFPKDLQFETYIKLYRDDSFWVAYSNTIFYTLFGTIWSMFVSSVGAYALSKKRLLFRKQFNFIVVFTMWFSAGIIPTFLNYNNIFKLMGIPVKWGMIIAFAATAYNVILLRSYFESVPHEIEEASRIDGASEWQIFTKIYIPMSKSAIATVALFYATARWNGYFWNMMLVKEQIDFPLQVYMRTLIQNYESLVNAMPDAPFAPQSYVYAILICSIIPILVVYPYIQKYFEKGVTVGGVKG